MENNCLRFKMMEGSLSWSSRAQPDHINESFFSSLMRDYFASLGDSAHPSSTDPRTRAITRFQELLLVAFREFSVITDETIYSERRKYRAEIVHSIESFSKRSAIRNLRTLERFSKDQAGLIYDALFKAISQDVGDAEKAYAIEWWYENREELVLAKAGTRHPVFDGVETSANSSSPDIVSRL